MKCVEAAAVCKHVLPHTFIVSSKLLLYFGLSDVKLRCFFRFCLFCTALNLTGSFGGCWEWLTQALHEHCGVWYIAHGHLGTSIKVSYLPVELSCVVHTWV